MTVQEQTLIIGAGEVGRGLNEVIGGVLHDPPQGLNAHVPHVMDMHICFPYTAWFEQTVREYQIQFSPRYTVIHSTVPVGTSKKLGATHSPIRGVHPSMAEGIRTFVKYVGGPQALIVAGFFERAGVTTYIQPLAETTELLKLLDTTQYGLHILINRWCAEQAEKYGVPLEIVYKHANQTYNEGYTRLGRPEVVRPYLKHMPGPIGGHCVRENAWLIDPIIALLLNQSR